MKPYSQKVTLSAEEISTISITLRNNVIELKKSVKNASMENRNGILESLEKTKKLQQKFQKIAVKIEKEVLLDIKKINQNQ